MIRIIKLSNAVMPMLLVVTEVPFSSQGYHVTLHALSLPKFFIKLGYNSLHSIVKALTL